MTNTASVVLAATAMFVAIQPITEAASVTLPHLENNRHGEDTTASEGEGTRHGLTTAATVPDTTMGPKPLIRLARSDPVTNYYDFIINEGSYKFWAVFQVGTAALLIYSAFAAVYYAKYTFATTDYSDYDDDFFRRSGTAYTPEKPSLFSGNSFLGISPETFQFIMNAISSKKYS
ncbi:uncharacterized protein LOC134528808 [Bacillus rossius redtenbacheri]|uniref:uncharacterized protein LOC134528808 n=1 Tax=Bacillus rossius redtenbacheri TaxID=93214 RepID=UPI002FDE296F